MLLKNRVAVVTGANRGIGLAVTERFLSEGAIVVACVRKVDDLSCADLRIMSDKFNNRIKFVKLNLEDEISVKAAVQEIRSSNETIDVLVNNAGVATGGLFQMTSIAELRKVFEVNFFNQILFTQGISKLMIKQRSGSIINLSSSAAERSDLGTLAYGSSKAAFLMGTSCIATELGCFGIRVNSIAPGVTRTRMHDQMSKISREQLISSSIFKRAAEPLEVANVALFLASELSSFITGQCLRVDGGMA